ncbi:MAG: non-heme iron oxygenase ferredoxin subunit [Actinobacteria bacterium]|nr:non-heme iron oxygenase ferredoxin subunit [Actinomycetota bacterium]
MIEMKLSDLAENKAVKVELDGRDICVVRQGSEVFAIADLCSHAEASLSEGDVTTGRIECWLHGAEFDLRSGEAVTLPASAPIETYSVSIEGNTVRIG